MKLQTSEFRGHGRCGYCGAHWLEIFADVDLPPSSSGQWSAYERGMMITELQGIHIMEMCPRGKHVPYEKYVPGTSWKDWQVAKKHMPNPDENGSMFGQPYVAPRYDGSNSEKYLDRIMARERKHLKPYFEVDREAYYAAKRNGKIRQAAPAAVDKATISDAPMAQASIGGKMSGGTAIDRDVESIAESAQMTAPVYSTAPTEATRAAAKDSHERLPAKSYDLFSPSTRQGAATAPTALVSSTGDVQGEEVGHDNTNHASAAQLSTESAASAAAALQMTRASDTVTTEANDVVPAIKGSKKRRIEEAVSDEHTDDGERVLKSAKLDEAVAGTEQSAGSPDSSVNNGAVVAGWSFGGMLASAGTKARRWWSRIAT
ncbi:hypothetical protein LTR53_002969 [Teratosphaeriaceae sp. CCFEE 6253]|nr:hypothetical protein LTR53_002969 [Teratosphaeriaceae sp. CCFEE 6253]